MTVRFIPELAGITPYQPGLPIEVVQRRFGLERVVKLASNEFPLPPFPEVKEAVMGALDRLQRYPDGFSTDLREALAAVYDRSPEQITIGCGTCELLYLLAHATLERGDEVVLAAPSFTSYRDVIDIRGAVAVTVPLADHTHDLDAMAAAVTPRTRMVFVCNPNNPTGTYVSSAEVARFVERVPDDVWSSSTRPTSSSSRPRTARARWRSRRRTTTWSSCAPSPRSTGSAGCAPVRHLRPRGQAGGRQGAAAVQREPARAARRAIEALKHPDQVAERRETNARLRDLLVERLAERGRATVPSQANFMLVDIAASASRRTRSAARCSPWARSCATATRSGAPGGRG